MDKKAHASIKKRGLYSQRERALEWQWDVDHHMSGEISRLG